MKTLAVPGEPTFHTVLHRFGEDADGLHLRRTQHIPDWYLDELRVERENSLSTPAGEMHRVASIPVVVLEEWHAEGFDYNRAPIEDILARLRKRELDAFVTSKKF